MLLPVLLTFLGMVIVFASNVIDVDDILSKDFMPGSILVLENPAKLAQQFDNVTVDENRAATKELDGSFNNAFSTMGFHRFVQH